MTAAPCLPGAPDLPSVTHIALHDAYGLVRLALFSDQDLVALHCIMPQKELHIGDLVFGPVRSLDRSLDAAFLDLGPDFPPGFLPASDARSSLQQGRAEKAPVNTGIHNLLHEGQNCLLQVKRPALPQDGKGPRLTSRVRLAGRGVVYTPFEAGISKPKSFPHPSFQAFEATLTPVLETDKKDGFLLRSAATEMTPTAVLTEAMGLKRLWAETYRDLKAGTLNPGLVYSQHDPIIEILNALKRDTLVEIFIEGPRAFSKWQQRFAQRAPDLRPLLRQEEGLFETFDIDVALEDALQPSFALPSGGRVTIETTQALTAIDVDVGQATAKFPPQSLAFHVNLEAATAIAQALQMRNIGGLIVIDFVDMARSDQRKQLEATMAKALAADPLPAECAPLSRWGLMEMVRKRQGPSLQDRLLRPCPKCAGTGRQTAWALIALAALSALEKEQHRHPRKQPRLKLHRDLVAQLEGPLAPMRQALEANLFQSILLHPAPEADWPEPHFEIPT